jgi:hypothetical protein
MIRNRDVDVAISKEPRESRESRNVKEVKAEAKKKDDKPDENNERAGKKKGKGFFLFRPFRAPTKP